MSLPFWEEKCWGRVLHCFSSEQASVSYLEVLEGNQCSRHYHRWRANTFIVVSGMIVVEKWKQKDGSDQPTTTPLYPMDCCTVPSNQLHRFKVLESGTIIEVYFPDKVGCKVDLDDIERLDVGGPIR